MLRVLVDSGSSIKCDEAKDYNVEIIPLKIMLGNKEYSDDGKELSMDKFYDYLKNEKEFPKTSLPNLAILEDKVNNYTNNGDDVIIITISSKISGTYNSIHLLFEDNKKVLVIDSLIAVGGLRFIVDLINKNRDKSLDEIKKLTDKLILKLTVLAIPETLHYLQKGGRLSKTEWLLGSILQIKPTIGFKEGKVKVVDKNRGIKKAQKSIIDTIVSTGVDDNYDIIAAYTHNRANVDELVGMLPDELKKKVKIYDDLTPAIAAHWGPNAFGLVFVEK